MKCIWVVVGIIAASGPAVASEAYAPYADIEHGRAGLMPLALAVLNEDAPTIGCSVSLAHWYEADLGVAEAGQSIDSLFWRDPLEGTVYLLNATDHRMPIEALWCGIDGERWLTRSNIDLPRSAGETVADITIRCRHQGDRLVCQEVAEAQR